MHVMVRKSFSRWKISRVADMIRIVNRRGCFVTVAEMKFLRAKKIYRLLYSIQIDGWYSQCIYMTQLGKSQARQKNCIMCINKSLSLREITNNRYVIIIIYIIIKQKCIFNLIIIFILNQMSLSLSLSYSFIFIMVIILIQVSLKYNCLRIHISKIT